MPSQPAVLPELNDGNLEEVYQWIGSIPLSRPVRNIAKDLSDGVLIAEIIAHYLPRYIALNGYTHVNSVALKRYNWETLHKMVFKYLHFTLTPQQVNQLVNANCGVMESFLLFLKDKIDLAVAERRFRPTKHRTRSVSSRGSTLSLNQSDSECERESCSTQLTKDMNSMKIASTPRHQVNGEKDEQTHKLLAQIQYLERIIDQKDEHIAALTKKIELANIRNGTKQHETNHQEVVLKDEQCQILLNQIHYLEGAVQQKEEGIVALSKQVEKLLQMVYPENKVVDKEEP